MSEHKPKKITKFSKLSESKDYVKPLQTFSDKLSNAEIKKMLEDYKETKASNLNKGFHVRYFKKEKDNTVSFKTGGVIFSLDGLPDYIVLSNGKLSWSVQVKDTIFYQKMTYAEEKEKMDKLIIKKDDEITGLMGTIEKLNNNISDLKKEIKFLNKEIKTKDVTIDDLSKKPTKKTVKKTVKK